MGFFLYKYSTLISFQIQTDASVQPVSKDPGTTFLAKIFQSLEKTEAETIIWHYDLDQ